MENKIEKIGEGILLGIGFVVGGLVVSTCLIILTAFVEAVLTVF
jgi:hypothetical protein